MIPVPARLFVRYQIELSDRLLKKSRCETCNCEYIYQVTRSATGQVTSPLDILTSRYVNRLLKARAKKRLVQKFEEPDFVACPVCGWYQADMVRYLRKQRLKKGMIVAILAAFLVLAVTLSLAHAFGFSLFIAIIAAVGVFGVGVICTGWYTVQDPNDVVREVDRAERANQSRALTIDQHERHESQELAERYAREKAFAKAIARERTNEILSDTQPVAATPTGDDEFSFSELGRASQKASRQRQEKSEQTRRGKVRQVYAVVAGTIAGVIVDAILFGTNSDELFMRIIATLFLGIFCGLLGYGMTLRFLFFGGILTKHGSSKVSAHDVALFVALFTAGLPATWAAAGMEKYSAHGYACVIACEALALSLHWQFRRARPTVAS